MADARPIVLYAGPAVTSDGSGDPVDLGELHTLARGAIDVGSITGAGAVVLVTLEHSRDGAANWRAVAQFEFREPGEREFVRDELHRWVRLSWALGGASALGFSSSAESHVLYATRRDLRSKALSDEVLSAAEEGVVAEALLTASGDAEDSLRPQYPLPITTWPDSLKKRCAAIAKYNIFCQDGFQPQGVDALIVKDYDDAIAWLRMVATRRIVLSGVVEAVIPPVRVTYSRDEPDPPPRMSDDFGDF